MKSVIIALSTVNILSLLMHELDACLRGEWRMLRFLDHLKEETRVLVFLYFHVPLFTFLLWYFNSVLAFSNLYLWLAVNGFMAGHLLLHLIARRWKSNVFHTLHSFLFIWAGGISGLINLCLAAYY